MGKVKIETRSILKHGDRLIYESKFGAGQAVEYRHFISDTNRSMTTSFSRIRTVIPELSRGMSHFYVTYLMDDNRRISESDILKRVA